MEDCMENKEDIFGVIFPIMEDNLAILKSNKNPVYIKYQRYTNPEKHFGIKINDFVFFYISRGNRTIDSYAKIKNIIFKTPNEVKKENINQIQMKLPQFEEYIKTRNEKPMLVLELSKITNLKNKINIEKSSTKAGRYVRIEEFNKLFKKEL